MTGFADNIHYKPNSGSGRGLELEGSESPIKEVKMRAGKPTI